MSDTRRHGTDGDGERDEARIALADYFGKTIENAPPVPARLRELGQDGPARRVWLRLPTLASAAAITLLAIGLAFIPQRELDASPAAVLRRASQAFLELEDALLRMTLDSPALNFLASLDKKKNPKKPFHPQFWMQIQHPNRFLLWGEQEGNVHVDMTGYDGTTAWAYDEREKVLELQAPDDQMELGDLEMTSYLTFGFVRELQAQQKYDIEETTGPADVRAGRRTFDLIKLEQPDEDDDGPLWEEASITIDPETGLIERYDVALKLGPLSLFTFKMELAEINQGVDESRFRYQSHVPEGVTVRQAEPGTSKGIQIRTSSGNEEVRKLGYIGD